MKDYSFIKQINSCSMRAAFNAAQVQVALYAEHVQTAHMCIQCLHL